MLPAEWDAIHKLDPKQTYGTLQGLLLDVSRDTKLSTFLFHLVKCMLNDRIAMLEELDISNQVLKDHGLYTTELLKLGTK